MSVSRILVVMTQDIYTIAMKRRAGYLCIYRLDLHATLRVFCVLCVLKQLCSISGILPLPVIWVKKFLHSLLSH